MKLVLLEGYRTLISSSSTILKASNEKTNKIITVSSEHRKKEKCTLLVMKAGYTKAGTL